MDLKNANTSELVEYIGEIFSELKRRKALGRSRLRPLPSGFIRDLSVSVAIEKYAQNQNFPELHRVDKDIKGLFAINSHGERYSICTIYGNRKRLSSGVRMNDSNESDGKEAVKRFEKLVVCKFDDNCQLESICEFDWEYFLSHSKKSSVNSRYRRFELTKEDILQAKVIYKKI